ncbi:NAD-binding protein [Catenulispora yoronensis]
MNNLTNYAGKRVTVVGAGQAAIETAVLLDETGADVTLVARATSLRWNSLPGKHSTGRWQRLRYPDSGLGPGFYNKVLSDLPTLFRRLPGPRRMDIVAKTLGPEGSWWVRERFEKSFDAEHVRTGTQITSVRPVDGVIRLALSCGSELEADHVIAATGYEVDVRKLTVLTEELRGRVRALRGSYGPPVLGAGFDSSVPGLHIVGLASAATFGPAMRFVCGAGFAARKVAARLPR